MEIRCVLPLVLGEDERAAPHVRTAFRDGYLEAANSYNRDFAEQRVVLFASEPFGAYTCDLQSHFAGVLNGRTGTGWEPCFSVSVPLRDTLVLVVGASEEVKKSKGFWSLPGRSGQGRSSGARGNTGPGFRCS
jgi:hypothetical protein